MKKRRSVLALLLVAALTVVLGGCQDGKDGKADSSDTTSSQVSTESTPTGEPVMGGSITVGIPQDIEDSLDPHKSVAAGTKEILFNIYEGLVKPDEEGNLNDAVAESHSISEDGKVYTFKLRNGVKFHDGTTVTAEDVKYSIERCAGINGDGTPLVEAFSNVDKVEIPDESTIDIYLKEPDTEFLAYLTGYGHSGGSGQGNISNCQGQQCSRNKPEIRNTGHVCTSQFHTDSAACRRFRFYDL